MKILVTGSTGQLGTELRNVLEDKLPGITTYISRDDLDLTDSKALCDFLKQGMFTHVINCAAYESIDRAEEESGKCSAINTDAVSTLARYADEYGYKIIHLSTYLVYDGLSYKPYTESDKINPATQYGATKRKSETMLVALAPESIIIRAGWLFSPYRNNFVKKIIRLCQTERVVNVVSDQIGSPTYTRDLANAILAIITAQQWVSGVFNFANEGAASRYDFAKAIARLAHIKGCKINPILAVDYPTAAPRPYYAVLNKSRIKATYGIEIPHWEESLALCLSRMNADK